MIKLKPQRQANERSERSQAGEDTVEIFNIAGNLSGNIGKRPSFKMDGMPLMAFCGNGNHGITIFTTDFILSNL